MSGIRLFVLTNLTMVAFATNSILNRFALSDGEIGPSAFAAKRVAAGVVVLLVLLSWRAKALPRIRRLNPASVLGLTAYMLGFSFGYVSMDAGVGALVLFGCVQITMFLSALLEGERPPVNRWIGMIMALAGLAVLTIPAGPVPVAPSAVAIMALAGIGWGTYSLVGRGVADPLQATAWNFVYALPLVLLALLVWPDAQGATGLGILLAVVSGGATSALGYALWYAILPVLGATRGALAQISAPVFAVIMGVGLLGETLGWTAFLAMAVILGGIVVGLLRPT